MTRRAFAYGLKHRQLAVQAGRETITTPHIGSVKANNVLLGPIGGKIKKSHENRSQAQQWAVANLKMIRIFHEAGSATAVSAPPPPPPEAGVGGGGGLLFSSLLWSRFAVTDP
jgi:hypothetical protein